MYVIERLAAADFSTPDLRRLPDAIGLAFLEYLDTLPWASSYLNACEIPWVSTLSLDIDATSDSDYLIWLSARAIGQHKHVGIVKGDPPFGLAPFHAIHEPEALQIPGGTAFCFACDVHGSRIVPTFQHFLEITQSRALATI